MFITNGAFIAMTPPPPSMEELSATLTQLLQSQQLFQASFSASINNLTTEIHHLQSLIPPSDFSSPITPHGPKNHHRHPTPNICGYSHTSFSQQNPTNIPPFIGHFHRSTSFSDPFMSEIVKSKLNDEEDLKFKPLQLEQGESVDEQSSETEEGFCDFNKDYSSPVVGDLAFTILGDDDEESSFQSSSTNLDDIIIPTKQLTVSSFVFNDEHLVEENDDVGLSTPTASQTLVSILIPSNIDLELSELSSYVREKLKGISSKVFLNLNPTRWVADGSNNVFSGIGGFHDDTGFAIPPKPPDQIVAGFMCGGASEFKRYTNNLFSTFTHKMFVKIPLTPPYVNTTLLQELKTIFTLLHISSLLESLHCSITKLRIASSLLGPRFIKSFSPLVLDIQLVFPYDQFSFSSITKCWHERKLSRTPNRKIYVNFLIESGEEILLDIIKCDNPWYFILYAKFADNMFIGEALSWNDTLNHSLDLVLDNEYEFYLHSQYAKLLVESFASKLVLFYKDFGFDINGASTATAFKYPSVTPRECYVTLLVNEIMLLTFMYFFGKINHPSKSLVIVFSPLASTVLDPLQAYNEYTFDFYLNTMKYAPPQNYLKSFMHFKYKDEEINFFLSRYYLSLLNDEFLKLHDTIGYLVASKCGLVITVRYESMLAVFVVHWLISMVILSLQNGVSFGLVNFVGLNEHYMIHEDFIEVLHTMVLCLMQQTWLIVYFRIYCKFVIQGNVGNVLMVLFHKEQKQVMYNFVVRTKVFEEIIWSGNIQWEWDPG